jgi:hypothetical protein
MRTVERDISGYALVGVKMLQFRQTTDLPGKNM